MGSYVGTRHASALCMTYVISDACASVCDTACVDVCPVDAIHGPRTAEARDALPPEKRALFVLGPQLFIDPGTCIGCGMCEPECPVAAIHDERHVPTRFADTIARNAAFFG